MDLSDRDHGANQGRLIGRRQSPAKFLAILRSVRHIWQIACGAGPPQLRSGGGRPATADRRWNAVTRYRKLRADLRRAAGFSTIQSRTPRRGEERGFVRLLGQQRRRKDDGAQAIMAGAMCNPAISLWMENESRSPSFEINRRGVALVPQGRRCFQI